MLRPAALDATCAAFLPFICKYRVSYLSQRFFFTETWLNNSRLRCRTIRNPRFRFWTLRDNFDNWRRRNFFRHGQNGQRLDLRIGHVAHLEVSRQQCRCGTQKHRHRERTPKNPAPAVLHLVVKRFQRHDGAGARQRSFIIKMRLLYHLLKIVCKHEATERRLT